MHYPLFLLLLGIGKYSVAVQEFNKAQSMRISNRPILVLVILSVLTTWPWLGSREFSTRGEAREALAAQSVLNGNWIVPRGYGGIIASKPPLFHWCIAAVSYLKKNVTEFTSRFPAAFASLIFVICFYLFLSRRVGQRLAFISSLILMTSIEWFRAGNACRVDMLHSALFSGGLLSLYSWYEKDHRGYPFLSTLLFAAATLTKGPVSIALPLFIYAVFLWLRNHKLKEISLICFKVFLPAVLLSFWWYLAAIERAPGEMWTKVYYENVARFLSTMEDTPHAHSAIYLFAMLLVGFLPWSVLYVPEVIRSKIWPWTRCKFFPSLVIGVRFIAAYKLKRSHLQFQEVCEGWRNDFRHWLKRIDSLKLYLFVSAALIFLFYCIPSSKRSTYLLPLYPMISLYLAQYFVSLGNTRRRFVNAVFRVLCIGIIAIYSAGTALFFWSPNLSWLLHSPKAQAEFAFGVLLLQSIGSGAGFALIPLFVPMAFAIYFLVSRFESEGRTFLVNAFILIFSIYFAFTAVVFAPLSNGLSPLKFANEIRPVVRKVPELYSFKNEFYGLSLYLHKPMQTLSSDFKEGMMVFLYERNLSELRNNLISDMKIERVATSKEAIVEPFQRVALVRVIKE